MLRYASDLDLKEIYERLTPLTLRSGQLETYGYPMPDPKQPGLRLSRVPLEDQFRPEAVHNCARCKSNYRVDASGIPLGGDCFHHARNFQFHRIYPSQSHWQCCNASQRSAVGCRSNKYHVEDADNLLENHKSYVATRSRPELEDYQQGVFAIDCEMCYTVYGLELTRATVVDHRMKVVYDELVRPKSVILDYNTHYSGITRDELERTTKTLADVQSDLLRFISAKSILVGHSLNHDMQALKIFHGCYIETSQLYPHPDGLPHRRALRTLMEKFCGIKFQETGAHDSAQDARAAMKLAMQKANIRINL